MKNYRSKIKRWKTKKHFKPVIKPVDKPNNIERHSCGYVDDAFDIESVEFSGHKIKLPKVRTIEGIPIVF
jgi:hypothetical protein